MHRYDMLVRDTTPGIYLVRRVGDLSNALRGQIANVAVSAADLRDRRVLGAALRRQGVIQETDQVRHFDDVGRGRVSVYLSSGESFTLVPVGAA